MNIKKKIKILDFKLSKILNGGLFGAYKSMFHGKGLEFSEHKEYNYGDNIKDIDWKASSKTDKIQSKRYEEERDLNILFVLDNSNLMNFGSKDKTKKDTLEEVFYSLSLSAYYNNDNIGGLIFDGKNIDFVDYKKSRNNIYKILEKLENKNNDKSTKSSINNILNDLIKRQLKNNLIFILTDDLQNINEKLLKLIGVNNELVFININDYFENNLIENSINITLNGLGNFLNIDLKDKDKLLEYRQIREKKLKLLKTKLEKNRCAYIYLDDRSDILKELMGYFLRVKINN
ncbi:DUF58 domain-containing protein [Candidatus Gracilibacteria bacterium]|nr:DUF58 domain-containing protein [Candidatus Gracilibacteria bacterium]